MNFSFSIHKRLSDIRHDRKLTLDEVSAATGIATSSLSSYESDPNVRIPHTALKALAEYYQVSSDFLLGIRENESNGRTDIDDLHLRDDAVSLLKSGIINNRLLCELLCHPDFSKLISDLEIYVDGLANIQIQSLNAIVDTIRDTIMNTAAPEELENDKNIEMLKTAHIEDDDYFFNILNHDIDSISKDLRQKHMDDKTSAPDDIISAPLNAAIEEARNIGNNNDSSRKKLLESYFYFLAKGLRIKIDSLSVQEKEILTAIFERSPEFQATLRGSGSARQLNRMKKARKK